MDRHHFLLVLLILCVIFLSACRQNSDPAAKVVEDYLHALVNKQASSLSALSCGDWESNAQLELDSLQAVTTRLENLTCASVSVDGITTQVNCQGKILATYNNENQQLDLSVRTYLVIQQDGNFLVCGYK